MAQGRKTTEMTLGPSNGTTAAAGKWVRSTTYAISNAVNTIIDRIVNWGISLVRTKRSLGSKKTNAHAKPAISQLFLERSSASLVVARQLEPTRLAVEQLGEPAPQLRPRA